jgi:hypothetical protein
VFSGGVPGGVPQDAAPSSPILPFDQKAKGFLSTFRSGTSGVTSLFGKYFSAYQQKQSGNLTPDIKRET